MRFLYPVEISCPFPSTLAIPNLQNSQQFLSKFIFKGTVHLKMKMKILPTFIIPIPPYNENSAFFEFESSFMFQKKEMHIGMTWVSK